MRRLYFRRFYAKQVITGIAVNVWLLRCLNVVRTNSKILASESECIALTHLENVKERSYWGDLGVSGRIILAKILKK